MYFWGFSIIVSPILEHKIEYTLTTSWVCGSIVRDGPPGNWHTHWVSREAPANAHWWSWASMATFEALSTIEYFWSEYITAGFFVNTTACMNHFATSKVAFCCWWPLWSPLAFIWEIMWSPPAMGSGSDCTMSDPHDVLMVDFWHLSDGGTMALTGCRRFGSGVWAMTILSQCCFFHSGTLEVHMLLSWRTWSRCKTSYRMSKLSSLILDGKVNSGALQFRQCWSPDRYHNHFASSE